jgi:hypothetical protein
MFNQLVPVVDLLDELIPFFPIGNIQTFFRPFLLKEASRERGLTRRKACRQTSIGR